MNVSSRGIRVPFALSFAIVAACSAGGRETPPATRPPIDDGRSTGLLGGGRPPAGSFLPTATPLRRLTVAQYGQSVADLLGPSITLPDDVEADTEVDGFVALGAARTTPSARGVDQYAAAAYALAHQALSNEASRPSLVGCVPASPSDGACARDFVARFGRRTFRRPLAGDEIERYAALFDGAAPVLGDFHASLEYVVAAMLQSPYFLYRSEIGHPDPGDAARRLLGPFELAARLSYFFWNTTPDDALLEAAATGEITEDDGLARQVSRLAESVRAVGARRQFFSELFRLGRLDLLPQLPAYYPEISPTFGASARDETLGLVEDVVSRGADYRELLQSKKGFLNAEMATLYGAPSDSDAVPATLPDERAGMLTRAAFLAMNGHASSTSPTKRGKYVREVVLCQVIAPPPPNANVALREVVSPVPRTLRENLALHATNPICAACHTALDPVGLGVEEFDGIGAFRTTEAGRPVDNGGRFDQTPFAGAAELGRIVADDVELGPCLVRNLLRYATGHLESEGDRPVVDALSRNFEAHGRSVASLFAVAAASASFRYAGQPQ